MVQCMTMLYNQCDTIVLQLTATHADYVKGWFFNRKLRPTGKVTTKLRAVVETELSDPIADADVSIVGQELSGSTDSKGECTIDMSFGNYQVMVVNGSNSKTFGPYQFKKGKSRTIHFVMSPTFVAPDQAAGIMASKEKVK